MPAAMPRWRMLVLTPRWHRNDGGWSNAGKPGSAPVLDLVAHRRARGVRLDVRDIVRANTCGRDGLQNDIGLSAHAGRRDCRLVTPVVDESRCEGTRHRSNPDREPRPHNVVARRRRRQSRRSCRRGDIEGAAIPVGRENAIFPVQITKAPIDLACPAIAKSDHASTYAWRPRARRRAARASGTDSYARTEQITCARSVSRTVLRGIDAIREERRLANTAEMSEPGRPVPLSATPT